MAGKAGIWERRRREDRVVEVKERKWRRGRKVERTGKANEHSKGRKAKGRQPVGKMEVVDEDKEEKG